MYIFQVMEIVGPGDTIELQEGIDEEHRMSVSGGEGGNPIKSFGGWSAVINPDTDHGYHRAVQIFDSHIHLPVSLNTGEMSSESYRAISSYFIASHGVFGYTSVDG